MNARLSRVIVSTAVLSLLIVASLPGAAARRASFVGLNEPLPSRLSDQEFWALSEMASEPNGEFQSDNFLSNERGYQVVIPELVATAKPGRVYLGVGPEQNFPYIIALKPMLAVIFDVRRGNLHEQLLYKSLFEMSSNRLEFLSLLFSRPIPEGVTTASSVGDIMNAFEGVSASRDRYTANLEAVGNWLTKHHAFALHPDDLAGIDYVYNTAFYAGGPALSYNMGGRGGRGGGFGGGNGSTYASLQSLDDGRGVNRGFLGSEENWAVMKDLETRNLIVPVVGDFGGSKAIRAVGQYLKAHDALVSAFYLSNVEQYLNRIGHRAGLPLQRRDAAARRVEYVHLHGRRPLRRRRPRRRWRLEHDVPAADGARHRRVQQGALAR